ncbi:cbb3-type cytochrome c oxidase subunit I [Rhodanobacter sp. UC4450_H17]
MSWTIGLFLVISFVISLIALAAFIWAISNRQMKVDQAHAYTVFGKGEAGGMDDPTIDTPNEQVAQHEHRDAAHAGEDASSRRAVTLLLASAVIWLVLGSVFGVIASLKMHLPDWLDGAGALTFGRIRTLHLNSVIYGWLSLGGLGVAMWIIPRIFHTRLRSPRLPIYGAWIWNIALAAGLAGIAAGFTDGEEWLEIPWQVDIFIAIGAALFAVPLFRTMRARNVRHIYVTGWYFIAALGWFPMLFVIANIPEIYSGAQEATVNWWFAHNVLGLWLTPLGLGAAYYFIPKIIGKPIYSYTLSLLGFWALALFYSQIGIHHLVGGPVPTWLVTLSIVQSMMMIVSVVAVAINHHVTVARNLWALRDSTPLRFVWLGALSYTIVSLQGSTEALRPVQTVVHFTQYTIAHAHLGVYGFVSLVLFGSIYHIMPRMIGAQWPYPRLIPVHFWLTIVGFAIYFTALTIGGIEQGYAMIDASRPFADSVILLRPYLISRSVGGSLMTLGHLVFALNFFVLLARSRLHAPGQTMPVAAQAAP